MFSSTKSWLKYVTNANEHLINENRLLQERVKELTTENKLLRERNQEDADYRSGRRSHSEDILKAEQFFLRVFSKLRLTVSVHDFAKPIIDESEARKITKEWYSDAPHEDAKLWCLQIAKSKYGDNPSAALKFAEDLYAYISTH